MVEVVSSCELITLPCVFWFGEMDKDYLTLATSCIGYLSLALNLVCLFVRLVKHIKLSGDNDKFYSHKPSLSILLYIMTAARIAVNASLVWSFVSSKVF